MKPALQLNVAFELILLASVNVTDPFAGAAKGGQFAVNIQHTIWAILVGVVTDLIFCEAMSKPLNL